MNASLSVRLKWMIIFSTVILLVGLGYSYLSLFAQGISEQTEEYAQSNLANITARLDDYMEDLINNAEYMATLPDICSFLNNSTTVRLGAAATVRTQLAAYVNYKQGAVEMYLRSKGGTRLRSSAENPEANTTDFFQLYLKIQEDYNLSNTFRKTTVTHTYATSDGKRYFALIVPVFRQVAAPKDSDYLGALIAIFGMEELSSLIPASMVDTLLLCENGLPLYGVGSSFGRAWQLMGKNEASVDINGKAYQVLTSGMRYTPWQLHMLVFSRDMNERIGQAGRLCVIVAALILVVQFALLSLSHRSFVQPILDIVRQLQKIEALSERIAAPRTAAGEMITLVEEANNMLQRTEQINAEMVDARLTHYRERIIFLQTQINPHFLYNNLQCIRGMAASGNAKEVREMASCIAAIYRYGARDGAVATLREEMTCLTNYCHIIDLRYGSKFKVVADCSEKALGCKLPRMTLQPLIENSFKHGFGMAEAAEGQVFLSAEQAEGMLVIIIHDNGRGIGSSMLEKINCSRIVEGDPIQHLGVANVRTRLELLFGKHSSLVFASSTDGTTATVTVDQNLKK